MYKNIIPGLVSFDTDIEKIKGFEMCQDFNFYSNIKEKNKFHYKIILKNNIIIPQDYDFRSEYFFKKGSCWYYERKIFLWHIKFIYDQENRVFYFNKAYFNLPFRIGGISMVGEHIFGMIYLHLLLDEFIIMRGIAMQFNDKNICISAPGFNGKTTLLKNVLRKGAKYIAEDYLVLNLAENKVYPTCPLIKENFWQRRKIDNILKKLLKKNSILENSVSIDNIYLIQNSNNLNYKAINKLFIDFVLLGSLYFLDDFFVRSFIFEEGLTNTVFDRIHELKNLNINYKFVEIKNFDFNFL